MMYEGYHYLKAYLEEKYKEKEWFVPIAAYLQYRFINIRERIWETFRYVDPSPDNAKVFSYEYASVLRDIGSVFGSVLDSLVRETVTKKKKIYDIRDYKKYLIKELDDVNVIGVEISIPFDMRLFFPFKDINDPTKKIPWWEAYNNVKHSDITEYKDGNLSNVLYGLSSLAILWSLLMSDGFLQRYCLVGYFRGVDEKAIFPIG